MLVRARKDSEKTVMGLLALLPGLREIDHLNAEIAWYYRDDNRQLWTWRDDDHNQVQGVLGVEVINHKITLVRHISLTPDSRKAANYFAILTDYQVQYRDAYLMGTLDNQKLINKWRKNYQEQQSHN
ncbi:hypothetical protein [Leuconostoc fallax]|uniref:Riboflavin biosynthesis protein RibT n=1 Tax=Leuconostoc fallax TaxID=1251 RepID=A0A4R5N8L5_9LACO|nr:hypothetical protein [Leuconostoc fallax]MBU7455474.1 riboflavin biosynthesis protein RibT [Leuconostoc fallax]MCO6183730.1 riboflavin biosynthesis protein RibT [Leuconostoc fallax]TDG68279.1 hypothetical protein C5L23_000585 [Leuconostoc fallax]